MPLRALKLPNSDFRSRGIFKGRHCGNENCQIKNPAGWAFLNGAVAGISFAAVKALIVLAGASWYPTGTNWHQLVPSWYHLVPNWYQLVPAGTSLYQLVPACTIWYQLVPACTSWYQLVPASTSWYQLAPCWYQALAPACKGNGC